MNLANYLKRDGLRALHGVDEEAADLMHVFVPLGHQLIQTQMSKAQHRKGKGAKGNEKPMAYILGSEFDLTMDMVYMN